MTLRRPYLYALLVALGLLLWLEVGDAWQAQPQATTEAVQREDITPWRSEEALYECAMKAEELGVTLESMQCAADVMEGNLVVSGGREPVQAFYSWLESEGRFRAISGMQFETAEEDACRLSVSVAW